MYWRSKGISILPYLDDFVFLIMGYDDVRLLAKIVKEDMHRTGLAMNWDKSDDTPKHERRHLEFDVDLANGYPSQDGKPSGRMQLTRLTLRGFQRRPASLDAYLGQLYI
jgi:hypothetical protein